MQETVDGSDVLFLGWSLCFIWLVTLLHCYKSYLLYLAQILPLWLEGAVRFWEGRFKPRL